MGELKKLLTIEDAADLMSVAAVSVRKWLQDGKLKGHKIGGLWRIDPRDLHKFIYDGEEPNGEDAKHVRS